MAAKKARRASKKTPAAPASITQRARAKAKAAPEKTDRVRHIVGLMAKGEWVTGVTVYDLADKWGLHHDTLRADSAEASRRVRDAIAGDEEIRGQVLMTLQTITQKAMRKNQLRTAVESVKAFATISGVEAAKNVNVGGNLAEILALGYASSGEAAAPPVEE